MTTNHSDFRHQLSGTTRTEDINHTYEYEYIARTAAVYLVPGIALRYVLSSHYVYKAENKETQTLAQAQFLI